MAPTIRQMNWEREKIKSLLSWWKIPQNTGTRVKFLSKLAERHLKSLHLMKVGWIDWLASVIIAMKMIKMLDYLSVVSNHMLICHLTHHWAWGKIRRIKCKSLASYPVLVINKVNIFVFFCSVVVGYCAPESSKVPSNFDHYLKERTFRYENFADRLDRSQSLNTNEYSWEEYGFSLVDRFYPEMGQLLDEKFRVCQELTYYTYVPGMVTKIL